MISYEKLYRLAYEKKITMQQLSLKIGFKHERSLSAIASRHQHITTERLSKICEVLECKPEDVFEFVEKEDRQKHRRVYIREDWQYSSDDYVIVNWEKLLGDIRSAGYSEARFSLALGKANNYLALKKNRKYTQRAILKEMADLLCKPLEEYI